MIRAVQAGFTDREFLSRLIRVSLPIAAQNLVVTGLNMIDTVMIGQLGETEIAAVALGNQVFFLLLLYLFGVGSGTTVFTAQFWGVRDVRGIRASMGIALMLGLAGAVLFTVAATLFPHVVLGFYTADAAVVALGSGYLRIVAVSYVATTLTIIFSLVLRSTGNVRLPLYVSLVSLAVNTTLNMLLIFGLFGFPALGVRGAAIATAVARTLEVVVLLTFAYRRREAPAGRVSEFLAIPRVFVGRFLRTAAPVILNEVGWSLGITMYMAVYARMGTDVVAAFNISETVARLSLVIFMGTANGSAIIIGNSIGAGKSADAERYARRVLALVPVVGVVIGGLVALLSPWIPLLFQVTPEVRETLRSLLLVLAVVLAARATTLHLIVGLLRSGGDTRFSLFVDVVILWCVGVPAAVIGGLVIGLPVALVYLITATEEVLKVALGVHRVLSGRWIHTLTTQSQPPKQPGPPQPPRTEPPRTAPESREQP